MIYFLNCTSTILTFDRLFTADRIQTNTELYPRGIKFLSDYIHEKGLKIGMYSSAGRYVLFGNSNSDIYDYYEEVFLLNMNNSCYICSGYKGTLVLAICPGH